MKKLGYSLLVAGLLVVLVTTTALASFSVQPRLIAGQTEFAGVVQVSGDANFLTVRYWLRGGAGWCMTESHVHVALSLDDFPQNKGGVIPGQFDYKTDHNGCVTDFTYTIPVDPEWVGNTTYLAAHAVVIGPDGQEETAWAVNCGNLAGGQFPGKNWSAYLVLPANAWY